MPLVSIIIPVYKAESFLSAAVDSVLAQTNMKRELILIDDGSTDESGAICDQYAEQHGDDSIRVIHQHNQGVCAARNGGIDVAQGEYVSFMDADDVIAPEYLQTLYLRLTETTADMSGAWYERFQEYIRHFKPSRSIVMLLYTYIMLYSPKKAQPYIFTALNRCRGSIKSFCSRLRSIHFLCEQLFQFQSLGC